MRAVSSQACSDRTGQCPSCEPPPPSLRAKALSAVGALIRLQGDTELAAKRVHEALSSFRKLGDRRGAAFTLNCLGLVALDRSDMPAATRQFAESLALRRKERDKPGVAHSLANLGHALQLQGNLVGAARRFEKSLALRREVGDDAGVIHSLLARADLAVERKDRDGALAFVCESLVLARRLGDKRGTAWSLGTMAAIATIDGQPACAVRLVGTAKGLYDAAEFIPPPSDQAALERTLSDARMGLTEEEFTTAFASGWSSETCRVLL